MFNAFISYTHTADDKFAPALQSALQKFAKPWYKKRNLEIYRDESSLDASPHLWENITKALDQSEYLILLGSPDSENSPWVNEEVKYWLEHKSLETILITLTEGEMKWDAENKCYLNPDNNSLPPALDNAFTSEPFYVDLRQSKTAADLSLDNPIFKKEVLKLAAKLHNKTPNDLASEEVTTHRKMMLVRNVAISVLGVLFAASIVLGLYAKNQQNLAEDRERDYAASNSARTSQNLLLNQNRYTHWNADGLQYLLAPNFQEPLSLLHEAASPFIKEKIDPPVVVNQAMRQGISKMPPWSAVLKHSGTVESLEVERNGKRLASLDIKGNVNIWDLKTLEVLKIPIIDAEDINMFDIKISWSGPQHLLVSTGMLVEIETQKIFKINKPGINWSTARSSPDGKLFAAERTDGRLVISSFDKPEEPDILFNNSMENYTSLMEISWNTTGDMLAFVWPDHCFIVKLNMPEGKSKIDGRFLGWSQLDDRFVVRVNEELKLYGIGKSKEFRSFDWPKDKIRVWPDALRLTRREIEQTLNPANIVEQLDMPKYSTLSPDLEYLFILSGDCGMGNAGGGCSNVAIEIYSNNTWLKTNSDHEIMMEEQITKKSNLIMRRLYGHIAPPTVFAWHPNGETFISGSSRLTSSFIGHDYDSSAIIWSVENAMFYPNQWSNRKLLPICLQTDGYQNLVKWIDSNTIAVNFTDEIFGAHAYGFNEDATYYFNLLSGKWEHADIIIEESSFVNTRIDHPKSEKLLMWPNRGIYWHKPVDVDERVFTNQVQIIDPKSNDTIILNHPGFVPQARWSPDGQKVLTTCLDGYARIFSAKNGDLLDKLSILGDSDDQRIPLDFADWSPDGKWVILSSRAYGAAIASVSLNLLDQQILNLLESAPSQGTTKEELWANKEEYEVD